MVAPQWQWQVRSAKAASAWPQMLEELPNSISRSESVLRVFLKNSAKDSLILRKPTTGAESEGVNAKKLSHGGGIRFEAGAPEYNTILNWIRGTNP